MSATHADAMLTLGREALMLVALISAPPIVASLCSGLLAALFQATTQIQDGVLAVVPKLAAAWVALAVSAPWIANELAAFATRLFWLLPEAAR